MVVGADVGIMGGSLAHEFMVINEHGEDTLVLCDACDYAANQQIAAVTQAGAAGRGARPTEEVATPKHHTIAALADSWGSATDRTAKATFFVTGDGRLVTAVVRGDFEVNETKLANAVKAVGGMRPAHPEEITAAGMEPGYASPIGAHGTVVVVDDLVAALTEPGRGRKPPRLSPAQCEPRPRLHRRPGGRHRQRARGRPLPAAAASRCVLRQGIEVGNIFKLGTEFTEKLGATYLAEDGSRQLIVMGCYGIGLGRSDGLHRRGAPRRQGHHLARVVAPYPAHLVALGASKDPAVGEAAEVSTSA